MSIEHQVDLLPYNTFGISHKANYFIEIHSVEEAQELFRSDVFKTNQHLFLGGGSNILLTKDFDGLVIKVSILGKEIIGEDENTITLKVSAGENWHDVVRYCVDKNWGGLENLSLIPGTVGAAPIQNIGAYGVEIEKNIFEVETVEISTGKTKTYMHDECHFGYRESVFKTKLKDQFLISSITLTLTKKNHLLHINYGAIADTLLQNGIKNISIRDVSDAVIQIRSSKLPDPKKIGNAGSFFKNPSIQNDLHDFLKTQYTSMPSFPTQNGLVKIPAAWLIEQCGWKGNKINNIGVHQHQALVLVNYGGGSGEEIWNLAMKIQASVKEKFDITLQPEVNIL
ncbi:MAG TPA: UDP-N-acetylmuramate dehydrogenase [Chryseolinea sp.]|nr:UDP-N-acetylmuramate dehydrogenase [Chryseolinea sp.]